MKKDVQLNGVWGVIGLVLVLLLGGYRFQSMSSYSDPALNKELKMRLGTDVANDFYQELKSESQELESLQEKMDAFEQGVTLHSVRISAPLLKFGNKQDVVVKVEYSSPGKSKKTEYIKYQRYSTGSWHYKYKTTSHAFWSNFL